VGRTSGLETIAYVQNPEYLLGRLLGFIGPQCKPRLKIIRSGIWLCLRSVDYS
jgi:hypothetical protein